MPGSWTAHDNGLLRIALFTWFMILGISIYCGYGNGMT